jgi:hypothetical protein
MTRQTGLIITIVAAVIFGCCAFFSCLSGVLTLAGLSTTTTDFSALGIPPTVQQQTPPAYGIAGICFSIFFVAIPVALWFFLVRGKNGEEVTPPAAPPAAEE